MQKKITNGGRAREKNGQMEGTTTTRYSRDQITVGKELGKMEKGRHDEGGKIYERMKGKREGRESKG